MNLYKIDVDSIHDIESAKDVIEALVEEVFIMHRNIQRTLKNLTSENVKALDFSITKVTNLPKEE